MISSQVPYSPTCGEWTWKGWSRWIYETNLPIDSMVIDLSAIETRTVARKDTKGGAHNNVEPVVDPRGHKSWQWHIVARQLEASIAVQLIPNVWVLGLITLTASTRLYLRDTSSSAFSAGGLSLSVLRPTSVISVSSATATEASHHGFIEKVIRW